MTSTASDGGVPVVGNRWSICALLFAATTINYLDRQVLSLLAPDLQRTIGWSEGAYGHMVTAFQCAYAVSLVGVGRLIDRIGVRRGYAISVGLWSVAAMGHAWVSSAFGFGVMRAVLGIFEAGNFPSAIKAVAECFPSSERSLANGIFNTGSVVGAILAPLVIPWLAMTWGWQWAFIAMGCLGLVWLLFWWPMYGRAMAASAAMTPVDAAVPATESYGQLLQKRAMWAMMVARLCSDPIWWFFLFWLAKFFDSRFGLKMTDMSGPLMTVYALAALGSVLGGWIPRYLLGRGVAWRFARLGTMLGCAVAVLPVMLAANDLSLWTLVIIFGVAMAAHCAWISNVFSLASEIFPRGSVATVAGLSGMVGSVGGMIMAQGVGFLLGHGYGYQPIFMAAACSYVVGWIIVSMLCRRAALTAT